MSNRYIGRDSGIQITPFDQNPNLGAQILEGIMAGAQQVNQQRQMAEQQRQFNAEQERLKQAQQQSALLAILGQLEGPGKMGALKGAGINVPEGTSFAPTAREEFQSTIANLPVEEQAQANRRRVLGSGLLPSDQTLAEKQAAGLALSPTQRIDVALKMLEMSGEDKGGELSKALSVFKLPGFTGKTVQLQSLEAQKEQTSVAKTDARVRLMQALGGGYQRASNDISDETFNKAVQADLLWNLGEGPLPSATLRSAIIPNSVFAKMSKNAGEVPGDLKAKIDAIKVLQDATEKSTGKGRAQLEQMLGQKIAEMYQHPFLAQQFDSMAPDDAIEAKLSTFDSLLEDISSKPGSMPNVTTTPDRPLNEPFGAVDWLGTLARKVFSSTAEFLGAKPGAGPRTMLSLSAATGLPVRMSGREMDLSNFTPASLRKAPEASVAPLMTLAQEGRGLHAINRVAISAKIAELQAAGETPEELAQAESDLIDFAARGRLEEGLALIDEQVGAHNDAE